LRLHHCNSVQAFIQQVYCKAFAESQRRQFHASGPNELAVWSDWGCFISVTTAECGGFCASAGSPGKISCSAH